MAALRLLFILLLGLKNTTGCTAAEARAPAASTVLGAPKGRAAAAPLVRGGIAVPRIIHQSWKTRDVPRRFQAMTVSPRACAGPSVHPQPASAALSGLRQLAVFWPACPAVGGAVPSDSRDRRRSLLVGRLNSLWHRLSRQLRHMQTTWRLALPPPPRARARASAQESWKRHHPGWRHVLWTDEDNRRLVGAARLVFVYALRSTSRSWQSVLAPALANRPSPPIRGGRPGRSWRPATAALLRALCHCCCPFLASPAWTRCMRGQHSMRMPAALYH